MSSAWALSHSAGGARRTTFCPSGQAAAVPPGCSGAAAGPLWAAGSSPLAVTMEDCAWCPGQPQMEEARCGLSETAFIEMVR
jgi:hypothetical protein